MRNTVKEREREREREGERERGRKTEGDKERERAQRLSQPAQNIYTKMAFTNLFIYLLIESPRRSISVLFATFSVANHTAIN